MKKIVTLSAVALAGATLGVGSTFGWWAAEDSQPQTVQVAQDTPAELKIESVVPVEAANDSEDAQIEIIGDLQTQQPKIAVIQQIDPGSSNLARLAKELEQQADELEKKGQKEAAREKRSVSQRIRESLPKVSFGVGTPKVQWIEFDDKAVKRPDHPTSPLEHELLQMQRGLQKAQDPATRKQLEAAIRELQMKMVARRAGTDKGIPALQFPIEVPAREFHLPPQVRREMVINQASGQQPSLVIDELRKVAENLQREGHKEQAQAIREHVERLQRQAQEMRARMPERAQLERRDFERRPGGGPREVDDRNWDRPRQEPRESGPRPPEGRGPGPHDGDRPGPHPGGFRGPEGHHPHPGPNPGDILGVLHALHHEVAQLRGEVHQLRSMLSHGHHHQPVDAKQKVRDEKQGKGEAKKRHDGDDDGAKHKGKKRGDDGDRDEDKGKGKDRDDDDDKGDAKKRHDSDDDDDDKRDGKKRGDDDDRDEGKNRKDKDRDDDQDEKESDDEQGKQEDDSPDDADQPQTDGDDKNADQDD